MSNANRLSDFSQAVLRAADKKEVERIQLNMARGEPKLFIPYEDSPEGHGIGYWIDGDEILAIRRMSNGYELHPMQRYSVEFLKKLIALAG